MSPELRVPSRTALAVVAVLVVVSSAGYGVVVHNPAPASPSSGPIPTDEPLDLAAAADDSTFAATMSFEPVDSDGFSVRQTWAFDGDTMVERTTFEGGTSGTTRSVSYRTEDASYRRYHAANVSTFETSLDSAANAVRVDEDAQVYYAVSEAHESPDGKTSPGLPLGVLSSVGFERVGTTTYQGQRVVEYAPTTGWTTTRHDHPTGSTVASTYVESASGTVLVDAETGTPYVANVSATFVRADSWADVLLRDSSAFEVSYRADLDGSVGETPAWVTELRENESTAA